jgi:hypothetical protein
MISNVQARLDHSIENRFARLISSSSSLIISDLLVQTARIILRICLVSTIFFIPAQKKQREKAYCFLKQLVPVPLAS